MKENIHYIYDRETGNRTKTINPIIYDNFEDVLADVVDTFWCELEDCDIETPEKASNVISNYVDEGYRFINFSDEELNRIRKALIDEYNDD